MIGITKKSGVSPGQLLLPLAFSSILSSSVTLVSTSTNLVVSGLLTQYQQPAISMFEMAPVGLPITVAGLAYMVIAGRVWLGGRRGSSAMRIEGRPYTTIERTLVQRMVEVILQDMCAAFEPLAPVNFSLDRLETNPRFAAIARPANAAILVKLRIDMEDRGGRTELLLPYATLEPIRKLLLQQFMGEKFGRDSIWESHLATELWSTKVNIEAILDEQTMPLKQVMDLEVGQTMMLGAGPDSKIELRCGGVPLLTGRMGRVGSSVAVRVDDAIERTDASRAL